MTSVIDKIQQAIQMQSQVLSPSLGTSVLEACTTQKPTLPDQRQLDVAAVNNQAYDGASSGALSENNQPQYKLQDAVLKNDLKQSQINQSQLQCFNSLKTQAFQKITELSSIGVINNIDNLCLMLMTAAEYSIQQTKIGDYRLQLVINAVFEYYISKNIIFDEVSKVLTVKLVSEIFENNKKKLLKLFSQLFDISYAVSEVITKKCV